MPAETTISLIVPVYNRKSELKELLDSLVLQKDADFELIIVDDGSRDGTGELVNDYNSRINLHYLYQANQGPGKARNNGLSLARGELLVFVDSDCLLPDNYIANLRKHLAENEFDAFGGPDTAHPDFRPFLKAVNYCLTSFIGTGGTRGSSGLQVTRYYPRSFNMGIRRCVYERIGGMIDLRHGQDMEYSARIYREGFRVSYFSDVFVYHKRRTDLRKFFKQIFNWAVTRHNLSRLDRNLLQPVHALPATVLIFYILTIIGAFLYHPILWLLTIEAVAALAVLFTVMVQAGRRSHDMVVALLAPFVFLVQIIAYGTGFLMGAVQRLVSKNKDKVLKGFTDNYYR